MHTVYLSILCLIPRAPHLLLLILRLRQLRRGLLGGRVSRRLPTRSRKEGRGPQRGLAAQQTPTFWSPNALSEKSQPIQLLVEMRCSAATI